MDDTSTPNETGTTAPKAPATEAHESWRPDADADPSQIEQKEGEPLIGDIVDALRSVFDPEIPVNIYDLGLIYAIDSRQDGSVKVEMTLTAPGCPVAEEIPIWVRDAVATVEGTTDIDVEIVWDPPWDPSMMSEYAKIELGLF
jgi:FeS assembly SUF system protein